MKKKQIEIAARAADSSPVTETMESHSLFTRREMLGITGMAGLAALTGIAPDAVRRLRKDALVSPALSAIGASRLHVRTGS
jgi:hypothetical protein